MKERDGRTRARRRANTEAIVAMSELIGACSQLLKPCEEYLHDPGRSAEMYLLSAVEIVHRLMGPTLKATVALQKVLEARHRRIEREWGRRPDVLIPALDNLSSLMERMQTQFTEQAAAEQARESLPGEPATIGPDTEPGAEGDEGSLC